MLTSMAALVSTHPWLANCTRIVRRGTGALLPALLSLVLLACSEKVPEGPRARGDIGLLLRSAAKASAIALVEIERVARIDRHAYRARARVERALSGPFRSGTQLDIAWEELALGRSPRFARGQRVLVAFAPLPTTTLWFNRFPPQLRNAHTLAVAASGEAFAEPLEEDDLERLARYVRLSGAELRSREAALALAHLLAARNEQLARSALELLDGDWSRPYQGEAEWVEACRQALLSPLVSVEMQRTLVRWLAQRGNSELTAVLEELARTKPALAPEAYLALETWGRPLPPSLVDEWLASSDAELRLAAVRARCAKERKDRLENLARTDPEPRVRAAALQRLRQCEGEGALTVLVEALSDRDPSVRLAVAAHLATLGHKATATLESFALAGAGEASAAAVAALEEMGAAGRPSLQRIAREHPDPAVRTLAELALGKPRHEHGSPE